MRDLETVAATAAGVIVIWIIAFFVLGEQVMDFPPEPPPTIAQAAKRNCEHMFGVGTDQSRKCRFDELSRRPAN